MHTSELVGIWNLQEISAQQPAEKSLQLEFKADGTWVERPSSPPELVPPALRGASRIDRVEGTYKLNGDVLERTFASGSLIGLFFGGGKHRSLIAINGDRLEMAAIQASNNKQKHVGIFVYKKVLDTFYSESD